MYTGVSWEEGTSAERMSPSDWSVGKPVGGIFLILN